MGPSSRPRRDSERKGAARGRRPARRNPAGLLETLTGSSGRAALLTKLLTNPGKELYPPALARETGLTPYAVAREVRALAAAGLLHTRREGRLTGYRVNEQHPIYGDLKSIVYKTSALGNLLRGALADIAGIDAAFVYGSVARNAETPDSDVDLLVVGAPDAATLNRALRRAETELGREISIVVMRTARWRAQLAHNDAFVTEVAHERKIFLVGDEQTLREP